MSEWISVKDKLPEHLDKVLVCYEDSDNILMASFQNPYGLPSFAIFFADGRKVSESHIVTHWMPLPEPPNN